MIHTTCQPKSREFNNPIVYTPKQKIQKPRIHVKQLAVFPRINLSLYRRKKKIKQSTQNEGAKRKIKLATRKIKQGFR